MAKFLPVSVACFALCLFACLPHCEAQIYSNDDGPREANFVAKVVLLDEFIHRFNNDSSSEIRRYYLDHHRAFNKSRAQVIRSLFNYSSQDWDSLLVERFIDRAIDPSNPNFIGFMQDGWYADADCKFLYNKSPVEIHLVLRVRVNPDKTSEWVISAVKPSFDLHSDSVADPASQSHRNRKQRLFIQPTANDTYFIELNRDFADKRRLTDIFDAGVIQKPSAMGFYQALLSNRLKFLDVKSIKYYYFQVHDWLFTVENFDRSTRNSGWLISSIRQIDNLERSEYEKKLLEE